LANRLIVLYPLLSILPYDISRLNSANAIGSLNVVPIPLLLSTKRYGIQQDLCETYSWYGPKPLYWKYGSPSYTEWLYIWMRYIKILMTCRCHVIIVPGWSSIQAYLAFLICKVRMKPYVLISDSQLCDNKPTFWKEIIKRFIVKRASSFFVAGKRAKEYLIYLGASDKDIVCGLNVVDNTRFSTALSFSSKFHNLESKTINILTIAHLRPEKNLERSLLALDCFIKYSKKAVTWHVVGFGPLRKRLQSLIDRMELPVFLTGHLQQEEIISLMKDTHLYWHPSISEPWGLAVNEAVASGLPCLVSSQSGSSPDLVNTNGWTYDASSIDAAIESLKLVFSNLSTFSKKSKEGVLLVSRYTPQSYANSLSIAVTMAYCKNN